MCSSVHVRLCRIAVPSAADTVLELGKRRAVAFTQATVRAHACLRREFRPTGPRPCHWFEPCTAETTRLVLLPGAQHAIPCQLATRDTTRQVPLQNCTRNVTRGMRRAPQKNTFTLCFAALRRRTESGACRPTVQRGTTRWNPTHHVLRIGPTLARARVHTTPLHTQTRMPQLDSGSKAMHAFRP